MKIYKDIISGDEFGSDMFPNEEIDDIFIRFKVKLVDADSDEGDYNTGANPSAEDDEQQTSTEDKPKEKVLDIVKNHRLTETGFNKKSFQAYLKVYMKKLLEKIDDSRKEVLKSSAQDAVKKHILTKEFNEVRFFIGESFDDEGAIGCLISFDDVQYMYYFKDGLEGEKV